MLTRLSDVPWGEFSNIYGSTEGIEHMIRNLLSEDTEIRHQACADLETHTWEQGSIFEVNQYVVPFLYEILSIPYYPERRRLIFLLGLYSSGFLHECLPFGIRSRNLQGLDWELDAYYAVRAQLSELYVFLQDPDVKVRLTTLEVLGWHAGRWRQTVREVKKLLDRQEDAMQVASCLITLGLVGTHNVEANLEKDLLPWVGHSDPLISLGACVGLSILQSSHPDPVQQFFSLLAEPQQASQQLQALPWFPDWGVDEFVLTYLAQAILNCPDMGIPQLVDAAQTPAFAPRVTLYRKQFNPLQFLLDEMLRLHFKERLTVRVKRTLSDLGTVSTSVGSSFKPAELESELDHLVFNTHQRLSKS